MPYHHCCAKPWTLNPWEHNDGGMMFVLKNCAIALIKLLSMPLSPSSCLKKNSKCKQVKKSKFELEFWSKTFKFKFESNFDFLLQLSLSSTWSSCWNSTSSSNLVFFLQKKICEKEEDSFVNEAPLVWSLESLNFPCLLLPLANTNAK